jgi:hypothetical protein
MLSLNPLPTYAPYRAKHGNKYNMLRLAQLVSAEEKQKKKKKKKAFTYLATSLATSSIE